MGTLNLCLETPELMQKESAQSDHPAWRKLPKCDPILLIWVNNKIFQYLDTFWTQQVGPIELIPFPLGEASADTSLEYPQLIILSTLNSNFFRVDPPLWDP